jgi:hypothetical protein
MRKLMKACLAAVILGLLVLGAFRVADAVSREPCYGGAVLNDRGVWVNPDRERLERGDATCYNMD